MKSLNILLVEDNPHDVTFISNALQQTSLSSNLLVVTDGNSCMNYISKLPPYANAITPDLIILDINMPGMDGIEVLKNIKHHNSYKTIPIVILTSSPEQQDILSAFSNYANSYVIKPMDMKSYFEVIREIENFWTRISETP